MEWSIGKTYDAYRPGTGKLLLPGAKIRWDIHYHSVGRTDHGPSRAGDLSLSERPEAGASHAPGVSFRRCLQRTTWTFRRIPSPPRVGFSKLRSAARLENFQPHMHLRGKAMAMQAMLPDGTIQMLSYVDRFDFNWMNNYIYTDDSAPVLPKGTIIRITAWYDNTSANKYNPDPNQWVGYGERTIEEMGEAFVNVTNLAIRSTPIGSPSTNRQAAARNPDRVERSCYSTAAIVFASVAIVSLALPAHAQFKFKQVPAERPHESGQSVTPAYEGWWQNSDGTYNLLFGYFNRNTKETLDIPIGPNNHMELRVPPDQGQPTHFLPRRQKGVFTVTVPKDFGDKKLTWTIVANGQTLSVPGHLGAAWIINPMSEIGIGNTPPTISFDEKGPSVQGPKPLVVERTAKAGEPLSLTVFAADDDKSLGIKVMRVVLEVALKAQGRNDASRSSRHSRQERGDDAVATPELLAAAAAAGFDARYHRRV